MSPVTLPQTDAYVKEGLAKMHVLLTKKWVVRPDEDAYKYSHGKFRRIATYDYNEKTGDGQTICIMRDLCGINQLSKAISLVPDMVQLITNMFTHLNDLVDSGEGLDSVQAALFDEVNEILDSLT